MLSIRSTARLNTIRCTRAVRVPRHPQHIRFQSTASSSSPASGSSQFGVGIAGGLVGAALFAGLYSFTPSGRTASKLNKAVVEAEKKYQEAAKAFQEKTPSADQAVDSIRHLAYSYVSLIPGGRGYVDAAFKDVDTVRRNHKEEVDRLINDAYKQFQDVSKAGLSLEAASKAFDVLANLSKEIAGLAGDALSDILDNHPQAKEKFGGSIDQLKQMGEQYGPEAKKQVDETWTQIKEVLAGGLNASSIDRARKLMEDNVEKVKKLGGEAWKKGLEEAKPYLDKSPKVKELVEKNADALKQGNIAEAFSKARSAVESGNTGDLENFIHNAVEHVGGSGSGKIAEGWVDVEQYLKKIPQGGDILPKLQRLGEVADQHKEEGERLLSETVEELKNVLEEKYKKAQKIMDNAKHNAK